jgi:heme-degrading monooxygenase HmoA
MFMRLLQLNIQDRFIRSFREFYEKDVIPKLKKMPGCKFVALIESGAKDNEFISLTLWEKQNQAENYESGEVFKNLFDRVQSYLSDSAEWKVQLSENLELEYKSVKEEPVIQKYNVAIQSDSDISETADKNLLYVRIVSLTIQKGKEEEFKNIYSSEIIPVLLSTKGCLYAYLTQNVENENSYISVTIWDSKKNAEYYESSGRFNELVKKVMHTFSDFYRWKLALENESSTSIKTSDDMQVTNYVMVTGKKL